MSGVGQVAIWVALQLLSVLFVYQALGVLTQLPKGKRLDAAVSLMAGLYVTLMAALMAWRWWLL